MKNLTRFLSSSIGRKILTAVTGLLLIGFLVAHVAGNLLIFSGRDAMNSYAEWLKARPALLWGMRLGLLAVFAAHIVLAAGLQRANRAARPVPYERVDVGLRINARSMLLTGFLILAYVVYHLLHFTLGVVQPSNFAMREPIAGGERHDVWGMVVAGFSHPVVTLSYVVAMVLLFLHLSHGIQSFFQTVGFNHDRFTPLIKKLGPVVAGVIVIAYLSIPLAILLGIVKETA